MATSPPLVICSPYLVPKVAINFHSQAGVGADFWKEREETFVHLKFQFRQAFFPSLPLSCTCSTSWCPLPPSQAFSSFQSSAGSRHFFQGRRAGRVQKGGGKKVSGILLLLPLARWFLFLILLLFSMGVGIRLQLFLPLFFPLRSSLSGRVLELRDMLISGRLTRVCWASFHVVACRCRARSGASQT